jgi:hypothetical protein
VLAPVFKLWFCGSEPFVGVVGLDACAASARHRPLRSAGVAVAAAVGRPSAPAHIGEIALLNSPDDIGEERSALILTPRPDRATAGARCAGVGILHRLRSCCYAA